MKRASFVFAAAALLSATNAFVASPAEAQPPQSVPTFYKRPPPVPVCLAADLGVRIHFTKFGMTGPHAYNVQVMAVVFNTSTTRTFDPAPGKAFGRLYEILPGQPPRLVSEIPVGRLAPGGVSSNNLKIYKNWDTQGSFATAPPSYRVVFERDANVRECNPTNNTADVEGSAIQASLTAT